MPSRELALVQHANGSQGSGRPDDGERHLSGDLGRSVVDARAGVQSLGGPTLSRRVGLLSEIRLGYSDLVT